MENFKTDTMATPLIIYGPQGSGKSELVEKISKLYEREKTCWLHTSDDPERRENLSNYDLVVIDRGMTLKDIGLWLSLFPERRGTALVFETQEDLSRADLAAIGCNGWPVGEYDKPPIRQVATEA